MIFTNECQYCGRKYLKPRDSLNVLMTKYCNSCYEYLNTDECIANGEGVADESGIWGEALFEKIML
jgi:hypothetical protein